MSVRLPGRAAVLAAGLALGAGSIWVAGSAGAETTYPALHDVTGVAANDVLNLRAGPNAKAALVGNLPPGMTGVEVVALSPDGKWARINQDEASGWAAMAYLKPQAAPAWFSLKQGLRCAGTEPFWTLFIAPDTQTAHFLTPDQEGPEMDITAFWPGDTWHPVAAFQAVTEEGTSVAVIRAEACSDGMSDAIFGLTVNVFSHGVTAAPTSSLRGCCTLAP